MPALLDAEQLRTLVAIVDSGSFTRAADLVFKTQSAVSMQMRRLEERVGHRLFSRDGRGVKLTEEGERLVDYARRIVRLNIECLSSLSDKELAGRVRLGVPDDYADRYLPAVLARFSSYAPRVEVTVTCEPSPMLRERIEVGELDFAIVTHVANLDSAEPIRHEELHWVTSARHCQHEERPLPLALGRPSCDWRRAAVEGLDRQNVPYRVLYSSWNSTAVGAAVSAGLAVTVLPECAVRPGMRILTVADGFPALPSVTIGVLKAVHSQSTLVDALAEHVALSLFNLADPNRDHAGRDALGKDRVTSEGAAHVEVGLVEVGLVEAGLVDGDVDGHARIAAE